MTESATCKLCSEKIDPETKFDLIANLKQEFPSEDEDLKVDENRIASDVCKVEVDEQCIHDVKEELKAEFEEVLIKNEGIVENSSSNTDAPSRIDECLPSDILYCYQCNYSSNDKQNLTAHVFTHCFKCNQCDYMTADNCMLMTHQQICSNSESLRFKCSFCDYSTNRSYNLKIHSSRHSDGSKFRCDDCDYKTHSKSLLTEHERIHFEEKPCKRSSKQLLNLSSTLSCKKCDYKTDKKHNLKIHSRIHIEEKQFNCKFCNFTTKWSTNLKSHLNTHSSCVRERNLCCDECEYKTYSKSHLTEHKRIHSEDRPFKCSLCDFSSKQSSSLRLHLKNQSHSRRVYQKRVHPKQGNIFKCSLCDFSCKKSLNFTQHLNDHSAQSNFTFVHKTYSKYPLAKTF